jgi:hypothetical protein
VSTSSLPPLRSSEPTSFPSYVSRANPRESSRHTILGTQWYKPRDFASQMNINLANGWGVVRTIADLCLKQPEGKYVLLKDPNKVRRASVLCFLRDETTRLTLLCSVPSLVV